MQPKANKHFHDEKKLYTSVRRFLKNYIGFINTRILGKKIMLFWFSFILKPHKIDMIVAERY